MTSLIFGTIYMGHHAVVAHKREKQRVKNYERWEGLRDEYDAQRQIQRESRSLDIQRTGYNQWEDNDKPILTLRDQQEANDARTGWRPQESWDGPQLTAQKTAAAAEQNVNRRSLDVGQLAQHPRAVSDSTAYGNYAGNRNSLGPQPTGSQFLGVQQTGYQPPAHAPLSRNKTGATWDEGLPPPLTVQRRYWDDENNYSNGVSRTASQRSSVYQKTPSPPVSNHDLSRTSSRPSTSGVIPPAIPEEPPRRSEHVEPLESHVPGGHMAQLIEGLDAPQPERNMDEWWTR